MSTKVRVITLDDINRYINQEEDKGKKKVILIAKSRIRQKLERGEGITIERFKSILKYMKKSESEIANDFSEDDMEEEFEESLEVIKNIDRVQEIFDFVNEEEDEE